MAFSEIELAQIDRAVGGLCKRRNRPELHEVVRLEYRVDRHDVILFEVRERYGKPGGKIDCPMAKLKFVRTTGEWRLLWMRSDLKWHAYEPVTSSSDLEELVREVDNDPFGCFFG